jgi:hypothetical protein
MLSPRALNRLLRAAQQRFHLSRALFNRLFDGLTLPLRQAISRRRRERVRSVVPIGLIDTNDTLGESMGNMNELASPPDSAHP